jgi:antirestriction protein ArdC
MKVFLSVFELAGLVTLGVPTFLLFVIASFGSFMLALWNLILLIWGGGEILGNSDFVAMPNRVSFDKDDGYFATLFHELIHSTGHASRLNRPTLTESAGFGSNPYCKEELIAEMGAAFLCGQAGIGETILENSAAYVQNWLAQLQNDKKLIVQAAAQAQKAADFILNVTHAETTNEK